MLDFILDNAVGIVAILGVFFEITPVKINPISSLLKYIGAKLNEDVMNEVTSMKAEIKKIDDKVDQNEIDRIRWEILDFANSCRNQRKHTREEFLHIIDLYEKYHSIIDEKKIKNGQLDIEFAFIKKLYNRCLEENSFLCANGDDDC